LALSPGTRLGPYEVIAQIGEGGMGQVYRARDTKLHRDVALKVLPDSFANDPDRLARFQREAQVLASLNHPNIAHIHGLEESDGVRALVMELVEGEDLAQRLTRGAIPIDEVLPIARQIAEALEAAHEQGIIHRDLKPANTKVTPDGRVKVLDFGLAKAMEPAGIAPSVSQSPTITTPAMTRAGVILGTAVYMSPEQARGRPVDARTDIWAFGCVLYETLAGRRAFTGEDVNGTLAAVILREPDWTALPPETPASIRRLLARCLRKDPKQRLHHIADARLELEDPTADGAATAAVQAFEQHSRVPLVIAGIAIVVLGGAAALQTARISRGVGAAPTSVHFSIVPPVGFALPEDDPYISPPVLSEDGTRVVIGYQGRTVNQLFTRRLDEDEMKPIPGTEGASGAFLSPDGRWVGFLANGGLKKVATSGGTPVTIAPTNFGAGAWAADDTIVYNPTYTSGLWRIAASGGTAQQLTTPDAADGELGHFWPQLLPDGQTVIFTSFRTPADRSRIELYSLSSGTRKVLVDGGFYGRLVAGSHLLFARSSTVFAVAFDSGKYEPFGQPVPVISNVMHHPALGMALLGVSNTGALAYLPRPTATRRLEWLDRTGRGVAIGGERRRFDQPALSPDGRRIAFTIADDQSTDIWVYDIGLGTFGRVTSSPTTQANPVWSPDSRRLYFLFEEPVFHLYSRALDGGAAPERLLDGPLDQEPCAASNRGLVYTLGDPSTNGGLWLLPLVGDRTPRRIVDTPAAERDCALSPDGRWLAFISDETGRDEVYVRPLTDGAAHALVSSGGGRNPRWSRDGRELFFREGDKMMATSLRDGVAGKPVVLFERKMRGYDVAADGRFLAVLPDETAPPLPVNVVTNWQEELRRLVPSPR
jgi:eukaryotic-like serine/threonine-protein kinase